MPWSSSRVVTVNLETSHEHEELEWCLPLCLALHSSVTKLHVTLHKQPHDKLCQALGVMGHLTTRGNNLHYRQMGHTSEFAAKCNHHLHSAHIDGQSHLWASGDNRNSPKIQVFCCCTSIGIKGVKTSNQDITGFHLFPCYFFFCFSGNYY